QTDKDALLAPDPACPQQRTEPRHAFGKLAIGPASAMVDENRLVRASGRQIAREDIGGEIVIARNGGAKRARLRIRSRNGCLGHLPPAHDVRLSVHELSFVSLLHYMHYSACRSRTQTGFSPGRAADAVRSGQNWRPPMLGSRDRILTTHVGSLPRSQALTDLLIAREDGATLDPALLASEMDRSVAEAVARQVTAGIDIGNDGEQQRVGFQTHIPERMSGFGGVSRRKIARDYAETPELVAMFLQRFPHRSKITSTPQATDDVRYKDKSQIEDEIARFRRCVPRD